MAADGCQGCQMVYFQTKNLNLGTFWRVLQCKMLVSFMDIWYILRSFGIFWPFVIFCGNFVNFYPFLVFCTNENLATLMDTQTAH
jgi:hypothetical protein